MKDETEITIWPKCQTSGWSKLMFMSVQDVTDWVNNFGSSGE